MTDLKEKMSAYRKGLSGLPPEYVGLHMSYALQTMPEMLETCGLRKLMTETVTDGWIDSMRVLRVVCEDSKGRLRDVRWSDDNGGSWFERLGSGGQALLFIVGRPGRF